MQTERERNGRSPVEIGPALKTPPALDASISVFSSVYPSLRSAVENRASDNPPTGRPRSMPTRPTFRRPKKPSSAHPRASPIAMSSANNPVFPMRAKPKINSRTTQRESLSRKPACGPPAPYPAFRRLPSGSTSRTASRSITSPLDRRRYRACGKTVNLWKTSAAARGRSRKTGAPLAPARAVSPRGSAPADP